MSLRNLRFAALLTGAALLFACLARADDKPRPEKFEDVYDFDGGQPRGPWDTHLTTLRSAVDAGRNKAAARGAITFPRYLKRGRRLGPDFYVEYPDLLEGDVAMLFGAVYRVETVSGSGTNTPSMRAKKIPDNKLPVGVAPAWDSVAVPLNQNGRGRLTIHDRFVRVLALTPPKKKGDKPTATISVGVGDRGRRNSEVAEAVVKEGDVVLLPEMGHKVRRVVLHDTKTRVIGWLELSPDPVPEAELVKQKIAFVRPKKREK